MSLALRQNALLLVVLTAVMAISAEWSGAPALTQLWRLPAGLLLLGLAYETWWVRRAGLEVTLSGARLAYLGKAVRIRFLWSHKVNRTLQIEYAPAAPDAAIIDSSVRVTKLASGDVTVDEFDVTSRQLGTHSWPKLRVRVAGPLGLAWWSQPRSVEFALHTVPDLLQASEQRMAAGASGQVARKAIGSGAEIMQLRDYRQGDSLRTIDWKATARTGKLVSRDFSEDQHLEIVVAIDAGRASRQKCGSIDRLGHYANIAARFAQHAVAHDDRIGIVVFADRPLAVVPPMRGASAVLRIRSLLAEMQCADSESNPLHAAMRIARLVRHRSLIVLLTDVDDATVASQLSMAIRLLMPKHLPLVAGLASAAADRLAVAPSRNWLDPYHSLAAQEYGARLRRNVQALHSLGAPALAVYPEQLENAVIAAYEGFRERRRV